MVTRVFRGTTYSVTTAPGNNRTLSGTDGSDWLEVLGGSNTVFGRGGNDVILAGVAFSGIIDFPIFREQAITYDILPNSGNNTIHAEAGDDYVVTGFGNDVVYLGEGNNIYDGAGLDLGLNDDGFDLPLGNDTVYAGAGDDIIATGVGDDTIYAGEGDNLIYPWAGKNNIYAGRGDDVIDIDLFRVSAAPTSNRIYAGDGNNTVFIYGRNNLESNTVVTGSGNDDIDLSDVAGSGAIGLQRVDAGNGRNQVTVGFAEAIDIRVGNGRDEILAVGREVSIQAGNGNNFVEVGTFLSARVTAGSGNDVIEVTSWGGEFYDGRSPITTTIQAGEGVNTVITDVAGDPIASGSQIYTGSRADLIISGKGNDTIYPGGGDNVIDLAGGGGVEGGGRDRVYAGSGKDLIILGATGLATVFQYGTGDRFDVPDGLGVTVLQSGADALLKAGGTTLAIVKSTRASSIVFA